MRDVTDRAGKAHLRYVAAVLGEAGICQDFAQVMTLGAHAIRPVEAEVWTGKEIRDRSARDGGLAELIVVLEDVRVSRTVRAIGPAPPNSRLSSLLWQSVQRIRTPIRRDAVPF